MMYMILEAGGLHIYNTDGTSNKLSLYNRFDHVVWLAKTQMKFLLAHCPSTQEVQTTNKKAEI